MSDYDVADRAPLRVGQGDPETSGIHGDAIVNQKTG
jgi:hypothetical protein